MDPQQANPRLGRTLSRRSLLWGTGGLAVGGLLLAGCSGDGSTSTAASSGTKPTNKVPLAPEQKGPVYPLDYKGPRYRKQAKIGDGTKAFKVVTRGEPELNYATNAYATYLETKSGVKIDYIQVPKDVADARTKVNALVAGGDLPDAIMSGLELFTISEIAAYGAQGLFIPLNDLIDTVMPNLQEAFTYYPELKKEIVSPDGKIYAVPGLNDCYHCKSFHDKMWINTAWLASLGLKMPKTLQEAEQVFAAFKGRTGGRPGYVVATAEKLSALDFVNFWQSSFGYSPVAIPSAPYPGLALENGKVVFVVEKDEYREGMRWIARQFQAGYFDKNMFTQNEEQLMRLGDNPGGAMFGIAGGGHPNAFTNSGISDPRSTAAVFKVIPPLEGPHSKAVVDWDWYGYWSPNFVITKDCKDPVTMARWADFQMELEATQSRGNGKRGGQWDWAAKGDVGFDGRQAIWKTLPGNDTVKNVKWQDWGPMNNCADVRVLQSKASAATSTEPILFTSSKEYEPYRVAKERRLPPLVFKGDAAAALGETTTNMTNGLLKGVAEFCTGAKDPSKDGDWEAFLDDLASAGSKAYVDLNQEALDARKG